MNGIHDSKRESWFSRLCMSFGGKFLVWECIHLLVLSKKILRTEGLNRNVFLHDSWGQNPKIRRQQRWFHPVTPLLGSQTAVFSRWLYYLPSVRVYVIFSFSCEDTTHIGFWRRQWHPTPVLLPGKSHRRRSLVGCSPWGRKASGRTERLHFHFSLSCIGEGNGKPL